MTTTTIVVYGLSVMTEFETALLIHLASISAALHAIADALQVNKPRRTRGGK